jgi:hypothetical protein
MNLDSGYYIAIEVRKSPAPGKIEYLMWGCYKTPAILRAQRDLSGAAQVELSGKSDQTNGCSRRLGHGRTQIGLLLLGADGCFALGGMSSHRISDNSRTGSVDESGSKIALLAPVP